MCYSQQSRISFRFTHLEVGVMCYTVDLVIFARFQFSRVSRRGRIREFQNLAKSINIKAILKKNENS